MCLVLSEQETTLLLKINHALLEEVHHEFITLRDRRDAKKNLDFTCCNFNAQS